MTGSLKYLRNDPNRKGRGSGYYYHRGNGEYSKYSAGRDKGISARTRLKNASFKVAHTGDGSYKPVKKYKSHGGRNSTLRKKLNQSRRL